MVKIVGVRFRSAGKVYYFNPKDLQVRIGEHVIAETSKGLEYGTISTCTKMVDEELVLQPLRSLVRKATEEDEEKIVSLRVKEKEALRVCREKVREHELEMKMVDAEYSFDASKVLFYFTADGRVDFRNLVKDLASVFHVRIELRQIGVRDETRMLGGIGICGRELCCATFLREFQPVSIKMAKEQNLSLNPAKISGTCGRLMCCLKNEEATYEFLNAKMPKLGEEAVTSEGVVGKVVELDVLRQRVRVLFEEDDTKEMETFKVSELTFHPKKKKDPSQQGKKKSEKNDEERRPEGKGGKREPGKNAEGRPENGENAESRSENGRNAEGRPENGRNAEGRFENGKNGKPEHGRNANGKPENGRNANGKPENGRNANGKPENGKNVNGKPENGKNANGKSENGRNGNGKAESVKTAGGKSAGGRGQEGREDTSERNDRSERQERNGRQDRRDKSDRYEKGPRKDRPERADRGEKADRGDKSDRGEKADRGDKSERGGRYDKSNRSDRYDRTARGDRSERIEKDDNSDHFDRKRPKRKKQTRPDGSPVQGDRDSAGQSSREGNGAYTRRENTRGAQDDSGNEEDRNGTVRKNKRYRPHDRRTDSENRQNESAENRQNDPAGNRQSESAVNRQSSSEENHGGAGGE